MRRPVIDRRVDHRALSRRPRVHEPRQHPDDKVKRPAADITHQRFSRRADYHDFAILYRGNFQARALEQFLRNQRIPYLLSGGQSFFDKSEIKDLTAYLRLLANEDDDPAFIRAVSTPRRGVGASTLQALGTYAGERHLSLFAAAFEHGFEQRVQPRQLAPLREFCEFLNRLQARAGGEPAATLLADLLTATAYEDWLNERDEERAARIKWGNVLEFCEWLGKKGQEEGKTLVDLTQTIALINLLDKNEADVDAVQLSTLHAAKGLEFRHVFLIGIEEGILPHREAQADGRIEEERRLMYVGITRAQRSLHLSYCERRKQGRETIPCEPSRFVSEMGSEDLRFSGSKSAAPADKAASSERLTALKAMLARAR